MALRDHMRALEPSTPLTPAERARLIHWRAVYVLAPTYGQQASKTLLFLRWLVEQGRLVS